MELAWQGRRVARRHTRTEPSRHVVNVLPE